MELFNYHTKGIDPHPQTGEALHASFTNFFTSRIRLTRNPDYVKQNLNAANLVKKATGLDPQGLNVSLSLARVLDLSRLREVYLWAEQEEMPEFLGFETSERTLGGLGGYLKKRLLDGGEDASLRFMARVFEAIEARRRRIPFGPVWCVWWRDFEDYLHEPAERWLELLGLRNNHTDDEPHWLIALKYPFASVGTLVRPTQIDAGWYPFHFQSPPEAPPEKGGHPMDLSMPHPGTVLLSEFIHQQVRHDIAQIQAGPKQTYSRSGGDLNRQRQAHHKRILHFNNGMSLDGWIGACVDQTSTVKPAI